MEATEDLLRDDDNQIFEPVGYDFGLSRRTFVQVIGAGLLIATAAPALMAQDNRRQRGRDGGPGGRSPVALDARLRIGKDGTITLLSGKVEGGQGARAQIAQAAAEELRVPMERITLILGDTALTPDDGPTVGSRTTPSTLPSVRQACAAAREMLISAGRHHFELPADAAIAIQDGIIVHGEQRLSYADLASQIGAADALKQAVPRDVELLPPADWTLLGTSVARPNARDLVTGAHRYPSDIVRQGMLYGKVLRPPSFGATLEAIDLSNAEAMEDIHIVRDRDFVAVCAPTTHRARQAMAALEKTAKWTSPPHPSSAQLSDHLRRHASDGRGIAANPHKDQFQAAPTKLRATYTIPYVQHAPMEPRAAVAQWTDGNLTVWTATQNPFRVRGEIAEAFHIDPQKVRVIVPDFGGAFGGKHTGECAVEAARIAQAAKKPVALRWTRAEEFTWAYFRPAAVMEMEAGADGEGTLSSWHFININSGRSGIETPYRIAGDASDHQYVQSDPPLRHGSYRALAAVANHFARESFMDELADSLKRDPLEYRLAHLVPGRLRDALTEAAKQFGWTDRRAEKRDPNLGIGLACGTEKESFVAACAEVAVDRATANITIRRICQVFECGKITTPSNLRQQVLGGIIQALGPALSETIDFEQGRITNASFWKYAVPRFADVPPIDIHLLDRPDLKSVGAGETPLIAVAPAIGNAIFDATGIRLRDLPLKLPGNT